MADQNPVDYKNTIQLSEMDIYASIDIGDLNHYIPTRDLERLLNDGLRGQAVGHLASRTRSKFVKGAVCGALGYPVPSRFARTQPKFPGQQLDVYVQKSLNLQIWNEQIAPARRYAIIQELDSGLIGRVRVIDGAELSLMATTGTVTSKYQARLELGRATNELVSAQDTDPMKAHVKRGAAIGPAVSPIADPVSGQLLPVAEIFDRLKPLIGQSFADPGVNQERNRGAALHAMVCKALRYGRYEDSGKFPDIRHQLLEIKLQTSTTIDLGLVLPSSTDGMDITKLGSHKPRHCDTRYAMFFAETDGSKVTLTHLFVTTGADFFTRFKRFEGKVTNGKIQIKLPELFFES